MEAVAVIGNLTVDRSKFFGLSLRTICLFLNWLWSLTKGLVTGAIVSIMLNCCDSVMPFFCDVAAKIYITFVTAVYRFIYSIKSTTTRLFNGFISILSPGSSRSYPLIK